MHHIISHYARQLDASLTPEQRTAANRAKRERKARKAEEGGGEEARQPVSSSCFQY